MDVLERIKRGYRAIGPGASRDVLAMFHQEQADPPEWVVEDSIHVVPAREVVAMDLFADALPLHWEVIGVDYLGGIEVKRRADVRPKRGWRFWRRAEAA